MRAILTYHSIDPSGSPISLDEATLRRHVAFLASGQLEVVPLEHLLATPPERHAVALTFDDGFVSFAELAWPLLRDAGLPVTLFVASRRAGTDNAWGGRAQAGIPTLALVGWDALKRMGDEGLDVGSHSRTHAHLTRASEAELEDELAGSAADLERELGRRPASFCYPYGDCDARVAGAARRHYALACTTELRTLRAEEDPLRLPRLDAFYYRAPGRLEAWGSPAFRAHLWLRARARALRSLVAG